MLNPEDIVSSVQDALAAFPQLKGLQALVDDGWKFIVMRAEDRSVIQMNGYFLWPHDVTDALTVRSETDAFGCRTLNDENGIVARYEGTFDDVVTKLRLLPPPDDPSAPRLVKGRGPSLWTPNR